jgi:hypothetical protein
MSDIVVNPDRVILKLKHKLAEANIMICMMEAALEESMEKVAQLEQQVLELQHDEDAPNDVA